MKINTRTTVSRGHRGSSHGFRHLTPGGALSGIDEEDASSAGSGGASGGSGGARSGANTGAPQQEQPNTTTLRWDGRTLRSSSSVCATYLYQNHKRRQLLQHLTSSTASSSSCVQRCLTPHSPHSHASHTTSDSYHQRSHSSRVQYHQKKHTHKPQEDLREDHNAVDTHKPQKDLREDHNPVDIACYYESENTGTAQVSRPLTTAVWENREVDISRTQTVSNKPLVDRVVDNRPVNSVSLNGTGACYKVTISPAETVVSSAVQLDFAVGGTSVPSSTCLTNGHSVTELAAQNHPGRWAAIGTLPTEETEPHTLHSRDITIQDLCIEETSDTDDFEPDEPVPLSGPNTDGSPHSLGELGDSCNQKLVGHIGTCVYAEYGSVISGERPLTVDGRRGGCGGQTPAMFSRYRSSSVPDHTFRQRDLGLLQTSVTTRLSETGPREAGTVNMPGGAPTTIVGAASAPASSSDTNREHAQLAQGCIDARPSTCPLDGSAGGVRTFPVSQSNAALRLGTLPQQSNAPEVGLTPPEDCDVPLPVRIPSAFSPHGGHYTPRRRELVRLSPIPVSPRTMEPLETVYGAATSLSSSSSTAAEHGFRPISPTRGAISNPTLHTTVVDSLPLPGSRYSRTPSPTLSVRSLSPGPHSRQRSNTFSGSGLIRGDLHSFLSPPRSPARLPRDAHQPSKGSISDLSDKHGSAEEAGEEADSFHFRPFQRQRSSTCPENRAWRRRKAAVANRPPTPPPLGGSGSRNSSPRGSLGETSRNVAGALVTLTPTHLTRRSDLSDLREDQDQADDVAESAGTGESPVSGDQTQTRQVQNGTHGNGTSGDSSLGVALMERLSLQNEAPHRDKQ